MAEILPTWRKTPINQSNDIIVIDIVCIKTAQKASQYTDCRLTSLKDNLSKRQKTQKSNKIRAIKLFVIILIQNTYKKLHIFQKQKI